MINYSFLLTDAIGGGNAVTVTCECGEAMRLQLTNDQLALIATAMFYAKLGKLTRLVMHDEYADIQHALLLCTDFTVWLLTHANNHTEQRRRDASKGNQNVH